MAHNVAPLAEADLDEAWVHVARQSGSIEIADRLIEAITNRFLLLAKFPFMGRSRDEEFGCARRSFAVGDYVIVYSVEGEDITILRIAHGSRVVEKLFGP